MASGLSVGKKQVPSSLTALKYLSSDSGGYEHDFVGEVSDKIHLCHLRQSLEGPAAYGVLRSALLRLLSDSLDGHQASHVPALPQ